MSWLWASLGPLVHTMSAGPVSCISQLCLSLGWHHFLIASLSCWKDDLWPRVQTEALSMVPIGFLLTHVLILEMILEVRLARAQSGVNSIWNKCSESQGGRVPRGILGCYKYRRRGNSCQAAKATKFLHMAWVNWMRAIQGRERAVPPEYLIGFLHIWIS